MEYNVVNLQKLLAKRGEEQTRALLSGFSCPLNPEIEGFFAFDRRYLNTGAEYLVRMFKYVR